MSPGEQGSWTLPLPDAEQGDPYRFRISTPEGTLDRLDPRALASGESGQDSLLWSPRYAWPASEASFRRPDPRDTVIYEMHAGTFHDTAGGQPGSLTAAAARLDHLASLGVNVIELMPIHDFPGEYSWGYNPRLLYAVDSVYGGPDALQSFVQEAHARGIAVILDVVYNHLSSPNPLCAFDGGELDGCGGIYFYEDEYPDTPWGPRFDYDYPEVRAYLQDNARLWVDTFHVDGFRWDSTGNIRATNHGQGDPIPSGELFLRETHDALREAYPGLLSIAEDLSGNALLTRPVAEGGYGFDAQWDAGFHASVVEQLALAGPGKPSVQALREALEDGGDRPYERVIYTESHDSTGELNDHVRLPDELEPLDPEGERARRLSAVAVALTLTAPGIPMLLQGQELLSTGTFHDDAPLDWTRVDSQVGFLRFVRDLVGLRRNLGGSSGGLKGEGTTVHHTNEVDSVVAFLRFDTSPSSDAVLVVVSLSPASFPTYRVGVPSAGTWTVLLDSSREQYGLGHPAEGPVAYVAESAPLDGLDANVLVTLPPFGVLVLAKE
jgi:1,4-alpha-glucan branching enzyme